MKIVFLGPHYDDCVLSCGELINKYVKEKHDVTSVTFFTGFPKPEELSSAAKQFHSNCFLEDDSMLYRQQEDYNALNFLNCNLEHLGYYECLYRKSKTGEFLYPDLKNIYHLESEDEKLIDEFSDVIIKKFGKYDVVFAPMGLGNHADHILINKAAIKASKKLSCKFYFYEEVPYVCYYYKNRKKSNWGNGMESKLISVSDDEWKTKINTIKFYRSQLHILWKNEIQRIQQLKDLTFKYAKNHTVRVWFYKSGSNYDYL